MKWGKIVKLIPHKVQITSRTWYEILWSNIIVGGEDAYGVTNPTKKQIIIQYGHKPKMTATTYLHEIVHAFSMEYDINLTETQVRKVESALYYILKDGNILKERKK